MSQTRRTEVVLQFFDKFSTPEFNELFRHSVIEQRFESAEEWAKKYGASTNPEAYNKQVSIVGYYEAAGHILQKGLANLDDIHVYAIPLGIVTIWEKCKPVFESTRRLFNYPDHRKSFEYLYNETKKKYPQLTSEYALRREWEKQLTNTKTQNRRTGRVEPATAKKPRRNHQNFYF